MSQFETKDTGVREEQGTGAVRDSRSGKGRYDLLPPHAVRRLAQVYERGAAKYADRNWEKGMAFSRYLDSALRHVFQHLEGNRDEDHLGHAVFNLMAVLEHQERIERGTLDPKLDDMGVPKPFQEQTRPVVASETAQLIKNLAPNLEAQRFTRDLFVAEHERCCRRFPTPQEFFEIPQPTEQPRLPEDSK